MNTYVELQTRHAANMEVLAEALEFIRENLDLYPLVISTSVIRADRDIYGLTDANGIHNIGTVEKTEKMWKFTAEDGTTFRTKNVDLIAVRALPNRVR